MASQGLYTTDGLIGLYLGAYSIVSAGLLSEQECCICHTIVLSPFRSRHSRCGLAAYCSEGRALCRLLSELSEYYASCSASLFCWLRKWDSNPRPSGHEPDELPLLHCAIFKWQVTSLWLTTLCGFRAGVRARPVQPCHCF